MTPTLHADGIHLPVPNEVVEQVIADVASELDSEDGTGRNDALDLLREIAYLRRTLARQEGTEVELRAAQVQLEDRLADARDEFIGRRNPHIRIDRHRARDLAQQLWEETA